MSDRISEKIDQYTKSNINRLRTAEEKSGRKLTKYDIARQMLSEGKLSQSDFGSWMNTREGYDSYTLSNQQKHALKNGSIWSFNNAFPVYGEQSYLDTFGDDEYIKEPITGLKLRKTPSKTQTFANSELKKDAETRKAVVDLLLSNAEKALLMLINYHNGIGYVSSDAFVQGMNVIGSTTWDNITGRNDFVTVFENESELEKLIEKLNSLKSKTSKPMEFAREFKELYGIEFDAKKFEKLLEVSSQINEWGVYDNLSKYFEYGISKIESSDTSSFEPSVLLAPIFGNNIAQAKEYIDDLRRECKDETELKQKLKAILIESKQEADNNLKEYNPTQLENDYKQAYKQAMGNNRSDEIIEQYIQIQKMNAMVTEVAGTIALALISSGSSAVLKTGTKAVGKFGAKIGGQVMKAGMTASMAAVPAAETIVGGLTSKEGLTAEKGEEAWEELKNGLIYGAFGAYVSGPLGNLVSKVLSKNPQIFSQIVASQKFSLGAGAAMETTADVLFDRITSDMTFKESMAQNGIINFGMMFVGARVHNDTKFSDVDLSQVKIEKMRDGSFNLKANGRVFFKAKNENELGFMTLVIASKNKNIDTPKGMNAAEEALLQKASTKNPVWVSEGKVKDKWTKQGLEELTPTAEEKLIEIRDGGVVLNTKVVEEYNANFKSESADEVTKLIFSGKLNDNLTKRYEEIGNVCEEIAAKYNQEFNRLAIKYKDEPQKYAEEIIKIFSSEFGMRGFEIPVEFIAGDGKTCYFDYTKGKILIDEKIQNATQLTTLLMHEYMHSLQFRDMTAQFGVEGVIDVVMRDPSIKPEERNAKLNETLNNDYNKNLFENYDFTKSQKGSVDDYLRRIYKDEFTDTKTELPAYIEEQIIEPEAYYNANGKFASNLELDGKSVSSPSRVSNTMISQAKKDGRFFELANGSKYIIDEYGQIISINRPAGIFVKLKNSFKIF